jgi:AcrR family transcriptional regulator
MTRADALRNRERVVAAAAAVFAERGVEGSVPEVAERAGVGKATVYRSFPTKEHLVAAVACERLWEFTRSTRAALDEPDAWAAFTGLLCDKAADQCADRTLTSVLTAGLDLPELAEARAALWAAVGELMERARADGRLRADARPDDLHVLWGGATRTLVADGVADPAAWRRYATLVLRALAA